MSMWGCPTHGLTGPQACCGDASRATFAECDGAAHEGAPRPPVTDSQGSELEKLMGLVEDYSRAEYLYSEEPRRSLKRNALDAKEAALRAALSEVLRRIADYENAISWGVNCVDCAKRLDVDYDAYEHHRVAWEAKCEDWRARAEAAERQRDEAQRLAAWWRSLARSLSRNSGPPQNADERARKFWEHLANGAEDYDNQMALPWEVEPSPDPSESAVENLSSDSPEGV